MEKLKVKEAELRAAQAEIARARARVSLAGFNIQQLIDLDAKIEEQKKSLFQIYEQARQLVVSK